MLLYIQKKFLKGHWISIKRAHPALHISMAVISSFAHTLTAQQAFLRTSALIDLSNLIKCDRPPTFLSCTYKTRQIKPHVSQKCPS